MKKIFFALAIFSTKLSFADQAAVEAAATRYAADIKETVRRRQFEAARAAQETKVILARDALLRELARLNAMSMPSPSPSPQP